MKEVKISRRTFLKGTGATVALLSLNSLGFLGGMTGHRFVDGLPGLGRPFLPPASQALLVPPPARLAEDGDRVAFVLQERRGDSGALGGGGTDQQGGENPRCRDDDERRSRWGGAHRDPALVIATVGERITAALDALVAESGAALAEARYARLRAIGEYSTGA